MKILVVCQFYSPEPFRITDICEEWVKRGHDVTVITGRPNYPAGNIYKGYEGKQHRDEVINGVKVHRCYEIPRKKGVLYRFLNYYSFAISSKRYAKKLRDEYDVVFINQLSPIMMANAAFSYKRKHGTKTVLYCLDLWPESLCAGGIKRGSLLYKHYHKVSKKIYSSVDTVAITSRLFRNYLVSEFNIDDERITYLPQYAESLFDSDNCKKKPNEFIDLVFAGNIGAAQNVETIVRAAAQTQDIANLRWHIVGNGSSLDDCRALAERLNVNSITFHGRRPLEEMPKYYRMADAMLITLINDDILSTTLPGKVQTYMSAAKPIIAAANGEIATVISEANCGFCTPAEDANSLAESVRRFCQSYSSSFVSELGNNASIYYKKNYAKNVFFERADKLLK